MDAAHSSAGILSTSRHVSHTGRDGTTPGNCGIAVRSPGANSTVMIRVISVPPTRGHIGSLQVFNKQQSTVSEEIRDNQKFDAYVDIKLVNDGDSTSIFSKSISS